MISVNNPRLWVTLLFLASAGIFPPAANAADSEEASIAQIERETRELLQALKQYSASQRDEALEKIRAAQAGLDRRIETLERETAENWNRMDQAARQRSLATLQALRAQRTRVAEHYGSLKSSSAAAWGHLKDGFSSAYGALHQAWEKAEREFAADN